MNLLETSDRRADKGAAALRTAREWPLTRGVKLTGSLILDEDRA